MGVWASPELEEESARSGQASSAFSSILHAAVARAMQLSPGAVRILRTRLTAAAAEDRQHVATPQAGLLLVDVDLEFCAEGAAALPQGRDFEHGLAVATQDFEAFSASALRLLALEELPRTGGADPAAQTQPGPGAVADGHGGNRGSEGPTSDEEAGALRGFLARDWLLWMGAVTLVAFLALCLALWRLARQRRKRALEPREFEAAVPAQSQLHLPQQPRGAAVATVLHALDLSSDAGAAFAAAAGLETSECLQAAAGELVEIIAQGEGWLYCRVLGSDLFGYLPEECLGAVEAAEPSGVAPLGPVVVTAV